MKIYIEIKAWEEIENKMSAFLGQSKRKVKVISHV